MLVAGGRGRQGAVEKGGAIKSKVEEVAVGLPEVTQADNNIKGNGGEGFESKVGEERKREKGRGEFF